MQRKKIRSGQKEGRMFLDENGVGTLRCQKGQMDQVEELRFKSWRRPKRKTECY